MGIENSIMQAILPYIGAHGIIVSFLAGFITGETIILTLAFLSGTGIIPFWYVLVFGTLGMYLSDFVPFTFGRFKFFRNIFKGRTGKRAKKFEERFLKYTKNNLFLTLLYTKFIYGASIPALVYLGYKKTSYARFAFYNAFVELIFIPLVVLVGWLSGKGFAISRTIFRDIRIAIFLLVILIIIFYFIRKWIDQKLMRKQKLSI